MLIWQRFTNVSYLRIHYRNKKEGLIRSLKSKSVARGEYLYGQFAGSSANDSFSFFNYMIELLWLFEKRSCVLSSEHENQNVAAIGTLLDQFMLSGK